MILMGIAIIIVGVILVVGNQSSAGGMLFEWLWLIGMKRYPGTSIKNRKKTFQSEQLKKVGYILIIVGIVINLLSYLKIL